MPRKKEEARSAPAERATLAEPACYIPGCVNGFVPSKTFGMKPCHVCQAREASGHLKVRAIAPLGRFETNEEKSARKDAVRAREEE